MANKDLGVKSFFNELSTALRSTTATNQGEYTRERIGKLIDHMSPGNRSGSRHSVWPASARLLLNDIYPDNRHFPAETSVLNNVIAHEGGLMGIEYMGFEKVGVNTGKVAPQFRFLTFKLPKVGNADIGGDKVITYFATAVPDKRSDVALFDKLDALVVAAMKTGESGHLHVVTEALKPGYQDIGAGKRLRDLLSSTP